MSCVTKGPKANSSATDSLHEHREAMSFDLALPQGIPRKRCRLSKPALPDVYDDAGKLVVHTFPFELRVEEI